jgi:hypothetical protein
LAHQLLLFTLFSIFADVVALRNILNCSELEFFFTFKEPKNRFQGTNSDRLCSLADRYGNPIPTRFLAP